MSVFFIGCPHIGHRNIAKYRPFVDSMSDNTRMITREWNERVHKRDIVYVMGDAAFDDLALETFSLLPGRKILIKGNHDDMVSTASQFNVFEEIHGIVKYKHLWLCHAPLHPDEIRGCKGVVHAHVHQKSIMRRNWLGKRVLDTRYFNTCVDVTYPKYGTCLVTLDQVKTFFGM